MPAFHLASGPWRLPSGMPVRWIGRSIGLKTLTGCGSWSRPTVVTASETDRVRVGMLAPVAWRVPPVHCGPWERVVSILPEGLVARGVDGTLFATADSTTRAAGRSRAARLCRRPIAGRQGVRVSAPLRLSSTPRRARSTSCTTTSTFFR
jgi:hypothetical protein